MRQVRMSYDFEEFFYLAGEAFQYLLRKSCQLSNLKLDLTFLFLLSFRKPWSPRFVKFPSLPARSKNRRIP